MELLETLPPVHNPLKTLENITLTTTPDISINSKGKLIFGQEFLVFDSPHPFKLSYKTISMHAINNSSNSIYCQLSIDPADFGCSVEGIEGDEAFMEMMLVPDDTNDLEALFLMFSRVAMLFPEDDEDEMGDEVGFQVFDHTRKRNHEQFQEQQFEDAPEK